MSFQRTSAPTTTVPIVNTTHAVVVTEERRQKKLKKLMALAQELGYVVQTELSWKVLLARAVETRLIKRSMAFTMQSVAFSLNNFPESILTSMTSGMMGCSEARAITWRFESESEVHQFFGSLLSNHTKSCTGVTRALKSASEPVLRLVATIMSQWKSAS